MSKNLVYLLPVVFFTITCTSGNCRENAPKVSQKVDLSMPTSTTDKVKVFKYDGSLQCSMGKSISAQEMKKDLKNISVYSAEKKMDGLMHIQMCGSATGSANVFQIDRKDLSEAKKMGFKEWLWD